jgi:hypothetical protein
MEGNSCFFICIDREEVASVKGEMGDEGDGRCILPFSVASISKNFCYHLH